MCHLWVEAESYSPPVSISSSAKMALGKLEELIQKQIRGSCSLGLNSLLSGGRSIDWLREKNGFGRQGYPGILGIDVAI